MNSSRRQFVASLGAPLAFARRVPPIVLSCSPGNDLYRALSLAPRFSTPDEAIHHARPGTGVLLLADSYPEAAISFPENLITQARKKRLRVYAEYASPEKPLVADRERAVVASSFFGDALPPMSILSLQLVSLSVALGRQDSLDAGKSGWFQQSRLRPSAANVSVTSRTRVRQDSARVHAVEPFRDLAIWPFRRLDNRMATNTALAAG
jgi:hypothetical protein